MNTATRNELDTIPTPVDEFGALRACVVGSADGCRLAWCHDGGRRKEPFGAVYSGARDAAAASRYLNARSSAGLAS